MEGKDGKRSSWEAEVLDLNEASHYLAPSRNETTAAGDGTSSGENPHLLSHRHGQMSGLLAVGYDGGDGRRSGRRERGDGSFGSTVNINNSKYFVNNVL